MAQSLEQQEPTYIKIKAEVIRRVPKTRSENYDFRVRNVGGKTPTTIDQSERRKESRDEKTDVFGRQKKER